MSKPAIIIRAWAFLFKHEKYRVLWALGLVAVGLYPTAAAWLSREVINSIITPVRVNPSGIPTPFLFAAAYGALTLLQGIVSSYSAVEMVTVKDRAAYLADRLLMDKAASSPDVTAYEMPEERDRIRLAALGGRALPVCFSGSVEALQQALTVVGLAVLLVYYHPLVAALVFLPALPLFYTQLRVRAHTFSALVYKSPHYRRMGYFLELMLGAASAKEVRVYRSGEFFLDKYLHTADDVFELAREQRRKATGAALLWGSVAAAGIGGAYVYVIHLAAAGAITVGDVVMYSGAVFYAGGAVRGLIQTTSTLWGNVLAVESFFAFLDDEKAARPGSGHGGATVRAGAGGEEWVLKNVSYSYPGRGENALEDISFSIRAKEKVAVVGLNGAGKTTLMKLMLRLLDPSEGEIKFRGVGLKEWDVPALRKEFGVVFQDFARFKLSLYENLALAANGRASTDGRDEAIFNAARLTGVDEIAKASPRGYETYLGKEFFNGTDLSGGQWQKIALARGFVRDAGVIFLDEPSASLDAKTEQAMFQQVFSLARDKTAIIISHRLSITPMVDRILVLEDGRLIEQGSHRELMERGGKYAEMYQTQAGMYWPKTG